MIYIIYLVLIIGCAWFMYIQNEEIRRLKRDRMNRDFNIGTGEILSVIQNSEEIAYYRDYYKENGQDWALHAIGAKEWSFQECKEYGLIIITLRDHQLDVGRDALGWMIKSHSEAMKRYREKTLFVAGADPITDYPLCSCEREAGIEWNVGKQQYSCKNCYGKVIPQESE